MEYNLLHRTGGVMRSLTIPNISQYVYNVPDIARIQYTSAWYRHIHGPKIRNTHTPLAVEIWFSPQANLVTNFLLVLPYWRDCLAVQWLLSSTILPTGETEPSSICFLRVVGPQVEKARSQSNNPNPNTDLVGLNVGCLVDNELRFFSRGPFRIVQGQRGRSFSRWGIQAEIFVGSSGIGRDIYESGLWLYRCRVRFTTDL